MRSLGSSFDHPKGGDWSICESSRSSRRWWRTRKPARWISPRASGWPVGTVNWLLKRLVSKGYVKVRRIGRWQWRYLVTPRGLAEKARLTRQYLQSSMRLYRETRKEAQKLIAVLKRNGHNQIWLDGDAENDVLDICRLTCLEQGVKVVDVERDGLPLLRVSGRKILVEWPREGSKVRPAEQKS